MIVPNVFGPFGKPYYNSVVATFSYQLTHQELPRIEVDAQLKLIYIGDLVRIIHYFRMNNIADSEFIIAPIDVAMVTEVLVLLEIFKDKYFENGIIPVFSDPFKRNLFNTFVCYIDHSKFYPFRLKQSKDERGSFVEVAKLDSGGQISFSTTRPGVTRGNHFHTRKAERFAVIKGKAKISLRRIGSDQVTSFDMNGEDPSFVDMPVWFTHNLTNTGDEDLYTIFWISESYDSNDPDTFFEQV